jgi:hypothetical protein
MYCRGDATEMSIEKMHPMWRIEKMNNQEMRDEIDMMRSCDPTVRKVMEGSNNTYLELAYTLMKEKHHLIALLVKSLND